MTVADSLQLLLMTLALAGAALGFAHRWAVANHRDRLASFTSAAGNAAGRIREALNGLAPDTDAAAVKRALVASAAAGLLAEFDRTGAKLGADEFRAAAMIEGQLGQIPPAPGAPVALTTLDAAIGAVKSRNSQGEFAGAAGSAANRAAVSAMPRANPPDSAGAALE